MAKETTALTFRIDYSYSPLDDQVRHAAKEKLLSKVGKDGLGDGGVFILELENREKPVREAGIVQGCWIARLERMEEGIK